MKGTRAFPRASNILRSVMIAGAGTAIWMVLSASAASADAGTADNHSILTEVRSNVSLAVKAAVPQAAAPTVIIPVPNVPLPALVEAVIPAKPISIPVPAVTPVVEHAGGAVDEILGTVPAVNQLVARDTIGTVVVPATGTVDRTVVAVLPPVTDVSDPIVQPLVEVVDKILPPIGSVTPPVEPDLQPLPGGIGSLPPAAPAGDLGPGVGTLPGSGVVSPPPGEAAAGTALQESAAAPAQEPPLAAAPIGHHGPSPALSNTRVLGSASTEQAVGALSTQAPTGFPAGPESVPAGLAGTGSGNSQNGPPSAAAAFLHGALIIPADSLTDLEPVSDEQHPKPVSFDPGSSPD